MLDPTLLKTFMVVAEGASFSETGRRLGLAQSSVSDHIRRLERAAGHRLIQRDTHSTTLTAQGEAMVEFARVILETNRRAERYFAGSKKRHRLRFGASEDCVASWLPEILRNFVLQYPRVDLEYTIALSGNLIEKFDGGELDVVLCKRLPNEERGHLIGRDPLVWAASEKTPNFLGGELPLVLYPPPSITRFMALAALEKAGVPWRITCTSGSLSGLVTAAQAGIGVMAHSRTFLPERLVECAPSATLPDLGWLEFVLFRARGRLNEPIAELSEAILKKAKSFL
jgi:DNA-binding transcriptional LysR family regulator